jgi:hypothetical protein
MSKNLIGICGDNCRFCPRYTATQKGDAKGFEKIKELWVKLGLRDPAFPAQDLACYGCKPESNCAYPELRICANKRKVANCGLCHEYPCSLIQAAFEKSDELHSRLKGVCTPGETAMLKEAFFSKRQNLDRVHRKISE